MGALHHCPEALHRLFGRHFCWSVLALLWHKPALCTTLVQLSLGCLAGVLCPELPCLVGLTTTDHIWLLLTPLSVVRLGLVLLGS